MNILTNTGVEMSLNLAKHIISYGLISCLLSSCFHPPFNDFIGPSGRKSTAGATGGPAGILKGSKPSLIRQLQKQNIQYVEYGDTMTLIVPTDKYYMFNSPRLNEICYPGLNNIVRLLRLYPQSPIYVAGFTDNVGSARHKKLLSQSQAETMLTFLWANNISARRLKAEGYADKNAISDNRIMHGSAQNRRIEIQWFTGVRVKPPMMYMTK